MPNSFSSHDDVMRTKGYVTPEEASRLCHTPKTTLYSWLRKGSLKALRTGMGRGRIYIAVSDLPALVGPVMEAQNVPAPVQPRRSDRARHE